MRGGTPLQVVVVSRGVVRSARLFYLCDLAGKAARVRDAEPEPEPVEPEPAKSAKSSA